MAGVERQRLVGPGAEWKGMAGMTTKQLTAAKRRRPTTQKMLALYAEQYDFGDHSEVRLTTPLQLVSEANQREHWSAKYKRKCEQQEFMALVLPMVERFIRHAVVKLIRLERYGKHMDDDNLPGSFKHVRDAIADWLKPGLAPGRADNFFKWEHLEAVDADGCKGLRVTFLIERQT